MAIRPPLLDALDRVWHDEMDADRLLVHEAGSETEANLLMDYLVERLRPLLDEDEDTGTMLLGMYAAGIGVGLAARREMCRHG